MSIKDLFGKTSPNLEDTVQDVESIAFVEEKTKADQTYHPQIDFSDPENFVYYGSAELYYDAAIRRIYEDYPYDGSKAEQIAFEEAASSLERWVFENKYPKTTGHIQLGTTGDMGALNGTWRETGTPEYIRVWGGLHTDSSTNLKDKFEKSAKFDEDKNRNQNWNCDFDRGVTIEFFMKLPQKSVYEQRVILDLWNGKSGNESSRFLLYAVAQNGNTSLFATIEANGAFVITPVIDANQVFDDWGHIAITLFNEGGRLKGFGFINGELNREFAFGSTYEFTGRMDAFIGALQKPVGTSGDIYGGKLQGSLDEFRFWKTKRTARQIKLNWFQPIGGGANTDDATSDLGVYLKFNEGIVGNNQVDNVVLDYSGRLANGVWIGYENTTSARSTESAMESLGYTEKPSPIIYKDHPSVKDLISEMQDKGISYDADRGQSFFRSMPTWLQEEDNGNLRLFAQILGSYMDTLHVQIKELTELKTKRYPMEGVKASTMAADLLKDKGFMISNMFESNEVYEKLAAINLNDAQFETDLAEIKNIIYTNIYNNLEKIYKTKGTEGSIRNLIRCYGIDDELIRLNLYTDGGTQYFTDKSRPTSVKKKYLNFNHPDRFVSTIFQAETSTSTRSFISAPDDGSRIAFTLEADIVVPYKKEVGETGYFATPFLSSSIMGFHEAADTGINPSSNYSWGNNGNDLQVFLVKDSESSRHAKFVMKNQDESIYQESDYIYDIYENEHYNVALRIKPKTYPYAGGVSNTTPEYDVELYAVTTNFGEIENEIILSQTITNQKGSDLLSYAKRVYAGAHLVDMDGAVQEHCDIQIGGVRAWLDYLDNDIILSHNKDVLNYGQNSSIDGSNLYLIDDVQIPTQDLTILNWDFDTVLTSDSSGEFEIEDITGGHDDEIYGWIDNIIRREHKAKGSNFPLSDSSFVGYEFIQAYKKQLPESAYDAQNIYIKGEQEINFSDDDDVSDNLFIMEKSPAALISEEMLKSFSTTLEFANLIGRPVERFRLEYKDLAKARQLFFDKVESDMDFDKFFEYFKWIDSSISSMVNQLIPMSANFAGGIVDVIEPHMLERDKYQRQVGLLNTVTSTEASIRGVQELKYNWRVGHAPLSGDENENCLWQKERKENDVTEEEAIRQVLVRQNDQEYTNPVVLSGSTQLISGSYAARRFSRPYALDIGFSNSIHGGINYSENKDRDMITTQINPGSQTQSGAPENVVIVGAGEGLGTNSPSSCTDSFKPEELTKTKFDGFAVLGKESFLSTLEPKSEENQYSYRQKISKIIPGNIISSSVNSGYSSIINRPGADGGFAEGYNLVNLHSDTTDITNEISIQGPFTNEHVGGRQSRHVHLLEGADPALGYITSSYDRPEFWNIYFGALNPDTSNDGAIGFTGPDYSVGTLDYDSRKAVYYREERAKRPVNIKNIQTIIGTGSHGNFTYNYEVLSTFGDQGYYLRRNEDLLPDIIADALPETTNYHTLIAQTSSADGNFFGGESNRQYSSTITTPDTPAVQASGGEFRVFGRDDVIDGEAIDLDGTFYEINTNAYGGVSVSTGGTDTQFYNNFKTALETQFPLNDWIVSYQETVTTIPGTFDAVQFDGRINGVGLETTGLGPLEFSDSELTISLFWNTPANDGTQRYLYYEDPISATHPEGRMLYSTGAGTLVFALPYVDNTGTYRLAAYQLSNFNQNYSGQLNHVVVTTNGYIGALNLTSLYIDGQHVPWSINANWVNTEPINPGSPVQTNFLSIGSKGNAFYQTTGISNSGAPALIDNLVLMNHHCTSQAEIDELYNNGERNNPSNPGFMNLNIADVTHWFTFEETGDGFTNGDTIHNGVTRAYVGDLSVYDVENATFPDGRIIKLFEETGSEAVFSIDPTAGGTYGNFYVAIDAAITSFDNPQSSTGGEDLIPGETTLGETNITDTQDRSTGSANVIRTRFSAPGGPEVNSSGYLDVTTQQYSVHNSLNYRNLTVRASGSGEDDRIRVNSHAGRREGLGILRSRHQGKFGLDSKWGAVTGDASFHKQHRNNNEMPYTVLDEQGVEVPKVRNDNDHYHRPLPATDFQYSWINNALNGEDAPEQPIFERAPKNGMVIGSDGYVPAINFPAISDFDQNLCLIARELRIPIVNITSNDQLYSLSSANNLVSVFPTVNDFQGIGTEIIPSDWSTLGLDYQFASCCTEDPEFRLNSGEWTTTLPTSEIPTGPIYYSPGSDVYLNYEIRDCQENIGTTSLRFADASYTNPTFSARLLYTAGGEGGGSEVKSTFFNETLVVAKDLGTRQVGEILPPHLSPDDEHAEFRFLCNSTLDSGQVIYHRYYGQFSDGAGTVYLEESEDFPYYHSPGLSLVVTYSPQAKLLEDSISITLNDASYGEPSVDLNFQIVSGTTGASGIYLYTTIPNPSFSANYYRFCIAQPGSAQCEPYAEIGNFTIDDFNKRTTLFIVSENLNVGDPGSYTEFKYRLSDIATSESEPNWQSRWLTCSDPTQIPFINYDETPIEEPANAGFKRRIEVVYFDYDAQGDLGKFNTYLQIPIFNVDMQRTETESAEAELWWTWGDNDENSESLVPTTRTDIVVGQFKYIEGYVYQNLTNVRNKDLLNMTVRTNHSWGNVPTEFRESITSVEFRRVNVASNGDETVVTDWTTIGIYDEINAFSSNEQFGYTDVVGELFVRKIEVRFNGYSEEWHEHSFYTWATIVVEDLEVTQLYTIGLA